MRNKMENIKCPDCKKEMKKDINLFYYCDECNIMSNDGFWNYFEENEIFPYKTEANENKPIL